MLKVGLIGCGFMGEMHANCYSKIDGVKVSAVADLRSEKAKKLADISNADIYNDALSLIEKADVDIIDICLPTYLHIKYALKAMEKVKYLFIEKPVALTKDEGKELIKKQRETGCQVQIGQVIRFWDEYMFLKDAYDTKKYGQLLNISFRRISPIPKWSWQSWILDASKSGGAAHDLHIHDSDFLLYMFGKPLKSHTIKNKIGDKNSYINTICEYENFVASIEGTWQLPTSFDFDMSYRAAFEKAAIVYSGGVLKVYIGDEMQTPSFEKIDIAGGGNVSELGGYINELSYFCKQAKNNQKIAKATLSDGVKSLEFVLEEIG